jgi:arylsulfatase A
MERRGWSYPRPGLDDRSGLPPVQLYDLERDVSEQTNIHEEIPEVVSELTALLTEYVRRGRSTPGLPQKNDGEPHWRQLTWM